MMGWRAFVLVIGLVVLTGPARALDAALGRLEAGERGRVVAVIDGDTVTL